MARAETITVASEDTAAARAALERQLADLETQIAAQQKELDALGAQKNTLANKIKQLAAQQKTIALQIKETDARLDDVGLRMGETQDAIAQNTTKLKVVQDQMAAVLVLIDERDHEPLWLFSFVDQRGLSSVLEEIERDTQLTAGLGERLDAAKNLAGALQAQQTDLAAEQDDVQQLLSIQTLQKQQLASALSSQNVLLTSTKGKESAYQAQLAGVKKQAAEIKARIYQLLGVSTQITFGQAVQAAQWVSAQTGVRPAFLLAILTQESNLGANVGTCNRPGDPPEKGWRAVMKPDRDQSPFVTITTTLGRDPDVTPVSCPMKDKRGRRVGWGGAMGPAQFIPSTWMGYRDRISAMTGRAADPWDIRDAFAAAAIKLAADGAADGSRKDEWNAAMRYFSGSTSTKYRFYGDSVLATADKYQADIDDLN